MYHAWTEAEKVEASAPTPDKDEGTPQSLHEFSTVLHFILQQPEAALHQ